MQSLTLTPDEMQAERETFLLGDTKLSPAMKSLTPKARAFVLAMVELGGRNLTNAAIKAGYTGSTNAIQVTASRLASDPRVQSSLIEEAKALARSMSLSAVATTVQIMQDESKSAQVRLNAAARIMALAALEPDKTVNVNHTLEVKPTSQEQVDQVLALSRDLGLDPKRLLGKAGVFVDAEFKLLNDSTGIEDLLGMKSLLHRLRSDALKFDMVDRMALEKVAEDIEYALYRMESGSTVAHCCQGLRGLNAAVSRAHREYIRMGKPSPMEEVSVTIHDPAPITVHHE